MMRYADEPFLQFLDYYVLRAIGELTDDQEREIAGMMSAFSAEHRSLPWFEAVAAKMNFTRNYPREIAAIWEAGRRSASEQSIELSPIEFTRLFVDANFPR